ALKLDDEFSGRLGMPQVGLDLKDRAGGDSEIAEVPRLTRTSPTGNHERLTSVIDGFADLQRSVLADRESRLGEGLDLGKELFAHVRAAGSWRSAICGRGRGPQGTVGRGDSVAGQIGRDPPRLEGQIALIVQADELDPEGPLVGDGSSAWCLAG